MAVRYTIVFDRPDDPLAFRLETDPPGQGTALLLFAAQILERKSMIMDFASGLISDRQALVGRFIALAEAERVKGNLEIADMIQATANLLETSL